MNHSAVLALLVNNTSGARIIRSYRNYIDSDDELSQAAIWEVVRATTASYGLFPEIVIGGEYGPGERLRGPIHGFSNPTRVAKDEVYPAFNLKSGGISHTHTSSASHDKNVHESSTIACLISVGAGKRPLLPLPGIGFGPAVWAVWALLWRQTPEILRVIRDMATNCESIHKGLQSEASLKGRYFRLNEELSQNEDGNSDSKTDDWSEQNIERIVKAARR